MVISFSKIKMYHRPMKKYKYVAFYKPFGVLCQFSPEESGDKTLKDFDLPLEIYAAGRLDKDSEGLLILTDDGPFNQKLTNPKSSKEKIYNVQVEKIPTESHLDILRGGVKIKDYTTKPAKVTFITDPNFPPRDPPIRTRAKIPTAWLEIKISEGKNRQVRRMTASIGFPTLRLIRVNMGKYNLSELNPGEWKEINKKDIL